MYDNRNRQYEIGKPAWLSCCLLKNKPQRLKLRAIFCTGGSANCKYGNHNRAMNIESLVETKDLASITIPDSANKLLIMCSEFIDNGYGNHRNKFKYNVYIGLLSFATNSPVSEKILAKNQ